MNEYPLLISLIVWFAELGDKIWESSPGWSEQYAHPLTLAALTGSSGFVLATRGGTIWVRALLDQLDSKPGGPLDDAALEEHAGWVTGGRPMENDRGSVIRAGRAIGHLERILIFSMVLASQWTAIGFILTAKSVARFKELENQRFAEYYLLGTLASALVAIAVGLVVRQVWSFLGIGL